MFALKPNTSPCLDEEGEEEEKEEEKEEDFYSSPWSVSRHSYSSSWAPLLFVSKAARMIKGLYHVSKFHFFSLLPPRKSFTKIS